MIENPTDVVVDALTNIASISVELNQGNEILAGEFTRILNVYSEAINEGHGYEKDKNIYREIRSALDKSNLIGDAIADLAKQISSILDLISTI